MVLGRVHHSSLLCIDNMMIGTNKNTHKTSSRTFHSHSPMFLKSINRILKRFSCIKSQKQPNKFLDNQTKMRPSQAFNQPANLTNNQAQVPWVRLINPISLVIRVSQSEAAIISALTNERRGEGQDTGTSPSPVCLNHKHLSSPGSQVFVSVH